MDKKSNMDFVMNGPRLQVNTFEGYENVPTPTRYTAMLFQPGSYHNNSSPLPASTIYPRWNELMLLDQWDGRQKVYKLDWPNGTTTNETQTMTYRYALATTTPGFYLIVTKYFYGTITFHYAKVGSYPYETSCTAKTLTVKLKKSDWGIDSTNAGGSIGSYSRSNASTFSGNVYPNNNHYMDWTSGTANGYTGTQPYISRVSNGDYWDQTFEFLSGFWSMKVSGSYGAFNCIPINMAGRKMGNYGDVVHVNPANEVGQVVKVYSRAKGCYCLKSYLNGEIPIINE